MNNLNGLKKVLFNFKDFVFSETIIFFGVAGIISIEFVKLVRSIINDFILQFFISITGFNLNFDQLEFYINGTPIHYGITLTYLINFLVVLSLLYLMVISPFKKIQKKRKKKTKSCSYCMNFVIIESKKCHYCHEYFTSIENDDVLQFSLN
jgi:large-conductance mechanosensitive channel